MTEITVCTKTSGMAKIKAVPVPHTAKTLYVHRIDTECGSTVWGITHRPTGYSLSKSSVFRTQASAIRAAQAFWRLLTEDDCEVMSAQPDPSVLRKRESLRQAVARTIKKLSDVKVL